MKIIVLAVFFSLVAAPIYAFSDAVEALIEVGRGQAEIQKAYIDETKVYERVRRAVDDGAIKKGLSKKDIREEYGEPVINYSDFDTKRDTWVYKPAKSDFMGGGIKVYLYFDNNDAIDEIAVTGQTEDKK